MATNTLICPFLNDDPIFAYGVEFGMLYARMQNDDTERIEDYFCRQNQEQILLLANRLQWKVKRLKSWDKDWFWLSMERGPLPNEFESGPEVITSLD